MAITVTNPGVGKFGWFLNATSADASLCEESKAAPAAGLSIIIDNLTISTDAAITITIGSGEAANACETVLLGPVPFAINQCIQWNFLNGGMVLASGKSLTVDTSGAGNINVFASGRVQ